MYSDLLKLYTEERRHWTLVLFQAIAAFFTAFAVLLYNTLQDVINATDKAPYYLLAYSMVSSIYLTVAILYFFYANRVDVYVKFHLEPLLKGVSWASFRNSKWMAGRESHRATRLATIPLAVLPNVLSLISLLAFVALYHERLLHFRTGNIVIQIMFAIATLLFVYTVYAVYLHQKFTKRWLFVSHPVDQTDYEMETLLFSLYQSISPGCVRQPTRHFVKP